MKPKAHRTVNEYFKNFPDETQKILGQLRNIVKEVAPDVEETIGYGIPTFKSNGKNLVHFAAYKKHIGFYPVPSGIEAFKKELEPYRTGKGTIRFPLDKPIPYDLIRKIVAFRVKQNQQKYSGKK